MTRSWIAGIALGLSAMVASPVQAAGPVVLEWQTPNLVENQFAPIWKEIIKEFEAANPGITIKPVLVARKDAWTRFVTTAQARRAPCIVNTDTIPAAADGYLLPIDKYWNAEPASFRAAWGPGVVAGSRYQGHLYGVPIWGGVYGEIYNRKMVVAAGLDPDHPPTTWAEYVTWMEKLTNGQHWGTGITAGDTDTTTRSLLSWIWSNGGEAFNADLTQATFASNPKSLAAIRFYIGLITKGYAAPGATTTNYLEQTTLFEQGKIASMRTAYWAIAKVVGDNPALEGDMIVGPPPATIPNPPVVFTQSVVSISTSCKYPADAWKFIAFESAPKWALMRATKADWLPLRRDVVHDPAIQKDPQMAAFLAMAGNARAYPLPTPIWSRIGSVDIVNAVQDAILHPDRIEPIFIALDKKLTQELRANQ